MKKYSFIILSMFFLSSCGEEIYDVEYYKNNHEKAEEILEKCKIGKMTGDNCDNARDGLSKYNGQKFLDRMNGKSN